MIPAAPQPMPRPAKGPRRGVMGRPRTQGCDTCRSKKVKCDEQRPLCGRCRRLQFRCDWPVAVTPRKILVEKKQTSKVLLPKLPYPDIPISDLALQHSVFVDSFPADPNEWFPTDLYSTPDDGYLTADWTTSEEIVLSPSQDTRLMLHPTTQLDTLTQLLSPYLPSPVNMVLGNQDVVLPDSMVLASNERRALSHYQHSFTASKLTKSPEFSTFGVFLRNGTQVPMVMHLLIAVSSIDLSRRLGYEPDTCDVAKGHFRTGTQMLIDTMSSDSEPNHISILTSWLLVYYYLTSREEVDPHAVNRLSATVLNYIRKYDLDLLCAGDLTSDQQSLICPRTFDFSRGERELTARLIVFLYWRDIWSAFQGYGGMLARYLQANDARMTEIYTSQVTTLENYWGEEYPDNELIDDVENTMNMEFGHQISHLLQTVNEFYEGNPLDAINGDSLEQKITALEKKYSSIFRLASSHTMPRSHLLRNADVGVALYHSLRIYLYRCRLTSFNEAPPAYISNAVTTIITLSHRALATDDADGPEYYQIPLFMAGIESKDPIHIDWISSKLSNPRFKAALEHITHLQMYGGGQRVTMTLVRQLLYSSQVNMQVE